MSLHVKKKKKKKKKKNIKARLTQLVEQDRLVILNSQTLSSIPINKKEKKKKKKK